MLVIYKESKNGKLEFTKEEFEGYLEKARKEGYNEGYRDAEKFYCNKSGDLPSPTYPSIPGIPISPMPYITRTTETSSADVKDNIELL